MAVVNKIVTGLLICLNLAFWVIGLAGIATAQDKCDNVSTTAFCSSVLGFYWWIIFFQLFIILLMVVFSLAPSALDRFQLAMLGTVAIETTLLMAASEFFNNQIYGANPSVLDGLRAGMAGTVTMSILNLIYIWLLADKSGSLTPALRDGNVSKAEVTHPAPAPVMTA